MPKFFSLIFILPLLSFFWVGCQKKEEGVSAAEDEGGEAVVAAASIDQPKPSELGFATRLPESVEFYASIEHPGDIIMGLSAVDVSNILFTMEDAMEGDESLTEEEQRQEVEETIKKMNEVMVKNAFICIDQGMAKNIGSIGDVYQNMQAYQMKIVTMMLSQLLKMDHPESAAEEAMMQGLLTDVFSGLNGLDSLLEDGGLVIPSLYAGCEPPSDKMGEWKKSWVESLHTMAKDQDGAKIYQFEKYGTSFDGVKLNISTLFNDAQEEVGGDIKKGVKQGLADELGIDLDDVMDGGLSGKDAALKEGENSELWSRLQQRWEQISMILVVGEIDGHLVIFLGKDADALVLVDKVEDSLAGEFELSYVGDGRLIGTWYASAPLLESFQTWKGYEKMYRSLAEVFTKEQLSNSEKIVDNFKALADLEHQLVERKADDFTMLCVLDEGLRIESVGGRHDVDVDFSQPLRLAPVADALSDDLFLNAHWRGNRDRQMMQLDYIELLVSVFGEVVNGGYLAFLERSESSAEWYVQGEKIYREILVPEVARMWNGYRKLHHQALDSEVAVLIDLNGGLPKAPVIPSSYIKEGKVPRLMMIRPVKDREMLDVSYADLKTSVENILEYTSILVDEDIPMPDFVSSDKGSLTTWYYSFPMMTNDFLPGVSVSDSLLMAGTSKRWAEEVYGIWEKEKSVREGVSGPNGAILEIRFAPLWDFTAQWLDLAEREEAAALSKKQKRDDDGKSDSAEAAREKMLEVYDGVEEDDDDDEPFDYIQARKTLEHLRMIKSIHWRRSKEGDRMRETLEIKVG